MNTTTETVDRATGEISTTAPSTPEESLTLLQQLLLQQHDLKPAPPDPFDPKSIDEMWALAEIYAKSEFVPKDFQGKPANCFVAMNWGKEIGLKAMQSLQNIAVINGRPSLWGDAQLALVRNSPHCEYVLETWDEHGTAICQAKRRGEPEQVRTFSVDDAKTAGLAGKSGPHTQYPKRMRQLRARGFALRDVFTDILKGMPQTEELLTMLPAAGAPLPRNASATQIAAAAAPKAERTAEHIKIIEDLEVTAFKQGFEAFKAKWAALPKDDRTAIGIAERDRIGAIGEETDEKAKQGVKP